MTNTVTVPTGNIVGMVFSLVVGWGLPIALCIWIRRKYKADLTAFFLGCGTYFVFAMVLEQVLHAVVLLRLGGVSEALKNNIWLYALYGGLAAGVFEETGRFLTMRYLMRKNLTLENALMYGAGHGGFEAMLVLGITSINNLVNAFLLNSGVFTAALSENVNVQQALEAVAPLATLPAWQFFLGGIERIMAVALQIALSLIIYQAVSRRKRRYLYPVAILFHALIDMAVLVVANHGYLIYAEAVTLAGTAAVCWFSWRCQKQ